MWKNEISLIGIALGSKTENAGGQSMIDCGNLWQKFEQEKIASSIPQKLGDDLYAVYYDYEGDYTKPFSFFLGCRVKTGSVPLNGMISIVIPTGNFKRFTAKGKIPDCIAETWKEIWDSEIQRAYRADFEIYDERSRDYKNAEVDIFISV